MLYKDYTSNPIPTSLYTPKHILQIMLYMKLLGRAIFEQKKRDVGMGGYLCVTCPACTLPSLHLGSVIFGTAIPTSLYIFRKCLLNLYSIWNIELCSGMALFTMYYLNVLTSLYLVVGFCIPHHQDLRTRYKQLVHIPQM